MSLKKFAMLASLALAAQVHAEPVPAAGTLVTVPAYGEVTRANDEATASFMVEEQDKDKAAAASRVNQKMKQGTDIVRREDQQATLKTLNYYSYPVYPEDRPLANGMPSGKPRVPTSWRVGQQLEVKTINIGGLPKLAGAVQKVLALSGIEFGLSPAATKALDEQRIATSYRNLNERIAIIAATMGRKATDAVLDTVDFDAADNNAGGGQARGMVAEFKTVEGRQEGAEPSFEPGETTLRMRVVGKVRFK